MGGARWLSGWGMVVEWVGRRTGVRGVMGSNPGSRFGIWQFRLPVWLIVCLIFTDRYSDSEFCVLDLSTDSSLF